MLPAGALRWRIGLGLTGPVLLLHLGVVGWGLDGLSTLAELEALNPRITRMELRLEQELLPTPAPAVAPAADPPRPAALTRAPMPRAQAASAAKAMAAPAPETVLPATPQAAQAIEEAPVATAAPDPLLAQAAEADTSAPSPLATGPARDDGASAQIAPPAGRGAAASPPVAAAASGASGTPGATPSAAPAAALVASVPASAPAPLPEGEPQVGAFEWPPSTRLSYALSGHYQGPVEGRATVDWIRQDQRYQVHLFAGIGPSFAPLVTRRLSSEGQITSEGLYPLRYEEETSLPLRSPRRVQVVLGTQHIQLANGTQRPRLAGVQDSASQFVQMAWLFTLKPQLLQVGQSVSLPVALPNRLDQWIYEVQEGEPVRTSAGEVPTWHVRPRRGSGAGAGTLRAEFWVAPTLQNLPVRIIIRQDDSNFIEMVIDRLPQQQAPQAQPQR